MEKKLVKIGIAAEMLGTTPGTLRKWEKTGELLPHSQTSDNGFILVSSSSHKMEKHDPFCSFNIQLCAEWALNCRSMDNLKTVMEKAGFCDIEILSEPSGFNLIGVGKKK